MDFARLQNRLTKKKMPCIWMQAGVVHRKDCKSDYQCTTCRFDRALRRACEQNRRLKQQGRPLKGKQGNIVFWKDRLKAKPPAKRPCLHHMKKRIDFKVCNRDYRCGDCEFDQYFNDQFTVHTVVRPVNLLDIEGFKVPHGFYLHHGHAWVRVEEGSEIRIGMDDFALRLLGPLDRIEAPLIGKTIKQNRADILVRRDTHKASILSPVSGVVTAINPELRKQGHLANQDPYKDGWVMRVHCSSLREDLKNLMIGNESGDFFKQEVERVYQVIEDQAGPLAADGGRLGHDIYGGIPQIGWDRLANLFLHT